MPIEYEIDHDRRIVIAKGRGTLTDADVFGYQKEVWSRADVAGYDELMDMSDVQKIVPPSTQRMRDLAAFSADTDPKGYKTKFAIVATQDFAFGLGRNYEILRELNPRSTKEINVFRSMEAALEWLGKETG